MKLLKAQFKRSKRRRKKKRRFIRTMDLVKAVSQANLQVVTKELKVLKKISNKRLLQINLAFKASGRKELDL